MATPRDTLASELRNILGRTGGVANVKLLPRFYQLLLKERRLKHRLTLLAVVKLTDKAFAAELWTEGLLKILAQWMAEATPVQGSATEKFLLELMGLISEVETDVLEWGEELKEDWKNGLIKLNSHSSSKIQSLSKALLHKWQQSDLLTTSAPVPLHEPTPPPMAQETEMLASPEGCPEDTEMSAENPPTAATVRVEGLLSPLPRAFQQKFSIPSPKRWRSTGKKSVHWAPPESLTTVRIFHQDDAPIFLLHPERAAAAAPADPTVMLASVGWRPPPKVEWETEWKVQKGEESEERKIQTKREQNVLAVDPSTLLADLDPEEPYLKDAKPQGRVQPLHISLDPPKVEPPAPVKREVRKEGGGLVAVPVMGLGPLGQNLTRGFVTRSVFQTQPLYYVLQPHAQTEAQLPSTAFRTQQR